MIPTLADARQPSRPSSVGVLRSDGEFRLVALRPVPAGERLFAIDGTRTDRSSRHSIQIDVHVHVDVLAGPTTAESLDRHVWRFLEHSCEPNVRILAMDAVACRDIERWELVTYDYNTTEWDMAEPFACRCGSRVCLGDIRGFRHLTPPQRERLRPFAAPHIRRLASLDPSVPGRSPA